MSHNDPPTIAENNLLDLEIATRDALVAADEANRSLERSWFLFLRATYGLTEDAAARAASSLPVLHVNGQLGGVPWLNDPQPRAYVNEVSPEVVRSVAQQIRIVYEEMPDDVLGRVRMVLSAAERICFLGFGYHPLNLARLDSLREIPSIPFKAPHSASLQANAERSNELFKASSSATWMY